MKRYQQVVLFMMATLVLVMGSGPMRAADKAPTGGKLLYFTLSAGYHHTSVEYAEPILTQMGATSHAFQVYTISKDVNVITKDVLKNYAAVMFYTTGELPFTEEEKSALVDFLQNGGGFIGVHSATDTLYKWDVYDQIIGGHFDGHPWHQMVTVNVVDPDNPLVSGLGKSFQIKDEIYQIKQFQTDSHILLTLDPTSVDLTKPTVHKNDYGWPICWTRSFGKGRVYYNSLGHEEAVWNDPRYQDMILKAIKWVMHEDN